MLTLVGCGSGNIVTTDSYANLSDESAPLTASTDLDETAPITASSDLNESESLSDSAVHDESATVNTTVITGTGDSASQNEELTQEEKDYIHFLTRTEAAKPYESDILPEFWSDYLRNDRVVGHIRLDGTDIDCPVLQKLEDYEYYLTHDIDNNDSKQGCIILDPDSEIGIGTKENGYLAGYEPSTNQLVHGHNMRAGTMFGTLANYASEEYGNAHKYIYFDSLYEHRVYELVTAFYSQIYPKESDNFKYYFFNDANTEEEFNYWYDNIMALSLYRTDIPVSYGDEMITLSTCSYHTDEGRFAVVGKRIE